MMKELNKNPVLRLTYKQGGKALHDISSDMFEIVNHVFELTFSHILIYHDLGDLITVNASDILLKKQATCLPYFEESDEKIIVKY